MVQRFDTRTADLISRQCFIDDINRELCPYTVLAVYGHFPFDVTTRKITYHSPFRVDIHPSFDVWKSKNDAWRWGDFAEGTSGSTIDLIIRFNKCSTQEAWRLGQELYSLQLQGKYEVPKLSADPTTVVYGGMPKFKQDREAAVLWLEECGATHPELTTYVSPEDLEQWGVKIGHGTAYCPYWNPVATDLNSLIVGHKEITLSPPDRRFASGSIPYLYGRPGWYNRARAYLDSIDQGRVTIVICEGEIDTWIMSGICKKYFPDYIVLGTPSAGYDPQSLIPSELVDSLFSRATVILALDGDSAGVASNARWCNFLRRASSCVIKRLPISDGSDVGSMSVDQIMRLWDKLIPYTRDEGAPDGGGIVVNENPRHYRIGGRQLSDWTFNPDVVLIGDNFIEGYSGILEPMGRRVELVVDDFLSCTNLASWANKHGCHWFGNNQETQRLGAFLRTRAIFCRVTRITRRPGLYDGDFVFGPSDNVAKNTWVCVPKLLDTRDLIVLPHVDSERVQRVMTHLLQLHRSSVVDPILAWLAIAPLRTLFVEFPILHISGSSGSGKTTLSQTMAYMFSGSRLTTNLTASTPFGITALFASTNAFPVIFDEYRPGARADALDTLNQLLRDCYTGQPSSRGAIIGKQVVLEQTPTNTPVIVTGEDTMVEISHLERSIVVDMPTTGANPQALRYLDFEIPIARAYLEFLLETHASLPGANLEFIRQQVMDRYSSEQLRSRPVANLVLMHYGWSLLAMFCEHHGMNLGNKAHNPNFQLIVDSIVSVNDSDPVLDALRWALDLGHTDAIWKVKDPRTGMWSGYAVSTVEMMRVANKERLIRLPFTTHTALAKYLESKHDARRGLRFRHPDGSIRTCTVLPLGTLPNNATDDEDMTEADYVG